MPEQEEPSTDVQGGFMFVALTGQRNQAKDLVARKKLRAHVMHNFRDQQTQGSKTKSKGGEEGAKKEELVGQKLRFRLKEDGRLEETVPLRMRRRGKDKEKEADEEVGKRLRRPSPDERGDQQRWLPDGEAEEPWFTAPKLASDLDKSQGLVVEASPAGYPDWKSRERGFLPSFDPLDRPDNAKSDSNTLNILPRSPLLTFGTARLDPLNTLPFQLSRRDEIFLDRFQHWETDSWCPVNGRGPWFQYAMRDKLLFHATMYHWGMHFVRTNTEFHIRNPEVLEHKLASFRIINERIQRGEKVRDETLAAVAAIVNIEISFGSRSEAKKHMAGMDAMVAMRGGIDALNGLVDGILPRFIGWNDLNYAELFGVPLRFAKISRSCKSANQLGKSTAQEACFRDAIPSLYTTERPDWRPLQGEVIAQLQEVRDLCDEVDKRPFRSLSEQEKVDRSDRLHYVERQLRAVAVAEGEDEFLENASDRMWRATALAGLMYVHHSLRGLPLAYRQFNSLSRDLQTALALTGELEGPWRNAPEILVWAFTVGTITSQGKIEHSWYVEKLASVCRATGYTSWEIYRGKMKSFLWINRVDDERYKKIWEEMEHVL